MSPAIAPKIFKGSVVRSERREREHWFLVDCRLSARTYHANNAPDMSGRTRRPMLGSTVASHERLCLVDQAMLVVEAAEL